MLTTVDEWLGKENKLGQDIWHNKYQYNNETFEEWLERISSGNKEIKQLIRDKKFLFGGRILSNRGLQKSGKKVTFSNCYVITPPDDSLESIFECASKLARTYSFGGGCGVDISKLAPKGAKVNNTAKETSGAVSFMDLYSMITGLIGQNGRRGALMLSISCNHPDLEEFIGIKSDLDRVTKANISVRITDDFMRAVEKRSKYALSFIRIDSGEMIVKEVEAYEVFHRLCEMNWDYAEPGLLYWDRIENYNILSNDSSFEYAGTNPCFDGDMELLTINGYQKFKDLVNTEPYIYNVDGNIVKSKVWCSGEKETVSIKTAQGEIVCTPEHRFLTIDGDECMAKNLKGKYIMPCSKANQKFDIRYIKYGFIQGDGQLGRLDSLYHDGIEVNIGEKDTDIYELFKFEQYTTQSHRAIYLEGYKNDLIDLGFSKENLPKREFPSTYKLWTTLQKASFLNGCYSANGSVIKKGRISYKTTCKKFAEQLAETLLYDFDIQGVYITINKAKKTQFNNGEYKCRESYDVNIGRYKEITKFVAHINFYQQYKREQLAQMLKNRPTFVYNVTSGKTRKVYDFTEPERHWGIVEGYIVHNCAEEPLPAGGSCLLGSINLAAFVNEDKTFEFDEFSRAVEQSVKALNEVLDEGLPLHPLQEQRESVRDWRQIGLGIMGLADMLIKMEIRYGSQESIDLCDKIGLAMADTAMLTSSKLATTNGAYPKYNPEFIMMSKWLNANASHGTLDHIRTSGLLNSQLLTIAPTGSLSTMLGISGGIEPIYANYYVRKTESLHGHDEYYKVYTPIVEAYMKEHGIEDDVHLPDYFVTAQTLNYKERIGMQGIWQDHIDASISSTVNVPKDFSVNQVEDLYISAWRRGLKGITIFRDGCKRTGILTTDVKSDHQNSEHAEESGLKRGEVIKANDNCVGKKRSLITGCGTLHCEAFFAPDTGKLLETYLSKGSDGGCNNFMIGLSRMISLSARGGIDIYKISDQLISCGVCPSYAVRRSIKHDTSKGSCCPVAVGNALIDMYEEFQKEIGNKLLKTENKTIKHPCPECGDELIFEGGCNICKNCGWSKCE